MAAGFSIVLPVYNQADHIEGIVSGYAAALDEASLPWQMVLVPNACRDKSAEICCELAERDERIRVVTLDLGGWGRAVRAGLAASTTDAFCYTNSARTTPEMLTQALVLARSQPKIVVKAQRKIRDNLRRQLGSLLYNLECRMLFGLATWDINGTPKVFSRHHAALLDLTRNDDVIDAEFISVCRRHGYPIVEMPIAITVRHGGQSTTRWKSAWRMYRGALELRREA